MQIFRVGVVQQGDEESPYKIAGPEATFKKEGNFIFDFISEKYYLMHGLWYFIHDCRKV